MSAPAPAAMTFETAPLAVSCQQLKQLLKVAHNGVQKATYPTPAALEQARNAGGFGSAKKDADDARRKVRHNYTTLIKLMDELEAIVNNYFVAAEVMVLCLLPVLMFACGLACGLRTSKKHVWSMSFLVKNEQPLAPTQRLSENSSAD